ncbi:MAG: PDDEXK nuclease domain-containing protein [Myxococcota bacterium]
MTRRGRHPLSKKHPRAPRRTTEDALFGRVIGIIEDARGSVARSVNTAMVRAYWLIGREIVEVEQQGARRAGYGDELIDGLATRLARTASGTGFSARTLRRMRQFYLSFPTASALTSSGKKIRSAVLTKSEPTFRPQLAWTHYLALLKVENPTARAFYEVEAVREAWSSRELERQIASLLFERLAKSRDRRKVLALARHGQQLSSPADVLKEPFVLEFLDLDERPHWQERDLEQAIIDRIEGFLLELGKGFCFVARQKRLTLDGDHFYVDLVFFNRLLRCFVLVDLKLGKLTHQDLGQMQMYVNALDRFQRLEHEAKTIGIILCSEKNDAMARITLPENNEQILSARYQMYLPTEAELRAELSRERQAAEQALLVNRGAASAPLARSAPRGRSPRPRRFR